jgi:diguanylate cyclase (GGDEF)-like protein
MAAADDHAQGVQRQPMKRKLDNARSIVEGILKEIKVRSAAVSPSAGRADEFTARLRKIEGGVADEFRAGIPPKFINKIRDKLGDEIIEALDPSGKFGAVFKNRERLKQVYTRIAALIEKYNFALKTVQEHFTEVAQLEHVQEEMFQSQVAHVQEVELFEHNMLRSRKQVEILLMPFEKAMKEIIDFLDAKQVEVYLFDDDRFLTKELKTDGTTFIYSRQQDEAQDLPQAVDSPTMQEVQETICEIPLVAEGSQIGHYRIRRAITEDFDRERWMKDVNYITPVAARIIQINQNDLQAKKVYTDDLTQLYNKRKLNEQMGRLFKQFKTGRKKLFVAMIDIDKFKTLNDTYGHPVGDEVLKQTALLIRDGVPYAYRYGGEEFCAVFYGYEKAAVLEAVEALRRRIETTPFHIAGLEHRITISAGIAEFEVSMNAVMDAIDRADKALYVSKEDGRNRCTYYDDIKDRYLTDNSRLRQRNLVLEEELAILRQQLAGKRAPKSRSAAG